MGSSCCKKSETKKSETETRNPSKTPNTKTPNTKTPNTKTPKTNPQTNGMKTHTEEDDNDSKKFIEDEKLEKELKNAIKGGESAYGKVKSTQGKGKKSLTASNYNSMGLIDKKSSEFHLIKDWLATKDGIKYELRDSIGSGNYAEVYKAWCQRSNRFVAVKAISLTNENENYRNHFLQKEIDILARLKHPYIVKHYEVAQSHNKVFMIMEFCANGSIADWLRDRGAFTESLAWEIDKRIADALHYMHNMSMAHRDIKLENILLTVNLCPKLSDFSYSVIVDKKEAHSTTFCGSLPYFAPEILQRKPHNPIPSDVWALGVCFYVMVCDGLPFKITDDRQMLNKQLERDWDFKKKVQNKLTNEFKQMVHKMLEPDVPKRITTQQLVNDIWFKTKPKDET